MKSQTSVEFLIVLSVVFVIIMTYLAATGSFANIVSRPDRSEYWELARIGVGSIAIGNTSTITIMNNNPYPIDITNGTINFNGTDIVILQNAVRIQENSQTQINFEIECIPKELLRISFRWAFVNNLTGVSETFIPDRTMNLYCN
jgi:hypothetical protein